MECLSDTPSNEAQEGDEDHNHSKRYVLRAGISFLFLLFSALRVGILLHLLFGKEISEEDTKEIHGYALLIVYLRALFYFILFDWMHFFHLSYEKSPIKGRC
jgi:hypothetical protein